jgi:Flp pilus assembly protein TadD
MERADDPLNRDPKHATAYEINVEQQNAIIGKEVERALHEGNAATDATPPRYNDAEKSYQEALKLNPKEARAYLGLGRLYAAQNRADDAATAFKKAIEVKPKLAEAYFNLGMIYAATGKKDAALEQHRALQGLNADLAKRLKEFIDK